MDTKMKHDQLFGQVYPSSSQETDMEATTSNYFDVAVADDKEAEHGSTSVTASLPPAGQALPALEDKAGARLKRIAAAVERGKLEYKSEHAYTEREVGGGLAILSWLTT
jgi:hypothetical protein